MECGVVTQRAAVLFLSLLCFVSVPNKRLGGAGNMKVCDYHCFANIFYIQ